MLSASKDTLTSSFSIVIPLISFTSFIALAKLQVLYCSRFDFFLLLHQPVSKFWHRDLLLVLNVWLSLGSYNLTCFSLSTFCLGLLTFFLSFCISYFQCFSCLTGWLAATWFLAPGIFLILSSPRLSFFPKPRFLLLFICPACQPCLSLFCPSYWLDSFLLDHSGALGRWGKTDATHLYIIKHPSLLNS